VKICGLHGETSLSISGIQEFRDLGIEGILSFLIHFHIEILVLQVRIFTLLILAFNPSIPQYLNLLQKNRQPENATGWR